MQSFSFQFQFFSGEYPKYVCTSYNDEFLAIVQSSKTYPTPTNISFDMQAAPDHRERGLLHRLPQRHDEAADACTARIRRRTTTAPATRRRRIPGHRRIPGGSTGWLTTTAPIAPNEDITLRFVIFDEGDGVLDSAVLIDNFQWGAATVMGPSTGPIGYNVIKHHHRAPRQR